MSVGLRVLLQKLSLVESLLPIPEAPMKFSPSLLKPLVAAILAAFLMSGDCLGGGSGGGAVASQPGGGLGDIDAEVEYFQTSGYGTVQVYDDPTLPDVGFASIDPFTGVPIITMNPVILAQMPIYVQDHWYGHEFGHHYLNHTSSAPSKVNEHYADAYCVRVLTELTGSPAAAQTVIAWYEATPNPGDATHASFADRAKYMEEVLEAFAIDKTVVPDPAAPSPPSTGYGTLYVGNPFGPANIYINYQWVGSLGLGQTDFIDLPAGAYQVDWVSTFTGTLMYSTFVQVNAGQNVNVP